MSQKIIPLLDRSILEIAGIDRKKFLQGLITNDVNKASNQNLIYSAMLSAQGRFIADFFIFEDNEKIILDCQKNCVDELIKKLNFYKLRSQVTISKNENLAVAFNQDNLGFIDPRKEKFGYRFYCQNSELQNFICEDESNYHLHRIRHKIAEGNYDLTIEKSFILEYEFDKINAVDYQKGCYIGQETTARIHYRGELRKKIFHIKITNFNEELKNYLEQKINSETQLLENCAKQFDLIKENEIAYENKTLGTILSAVTGSNSLEALALIKISEDQNFEITAQNLQLLGNKILVIS